jgi:hypothetical protein
MRQSGVGLRCGENGSILGIYIGYRRDKANILLGSDVIAKQA